MWTPTVRFIYLLLLSISGGARDTSDDRIRVNETSLERINSEVVARVKEPH